jgi:glycerophosphoryl diester phosphodiesterase
MRIIAHRGFAAVAPENTVAAVSATAPEADVVEVDVRRCGSGELVALHDPRIDRVTDRRGRLVDQDLGTLQSLSVEGSGEPVARFADVVDAVPTDVDLIVELKESGLVADTLDVAADHDGRVVVSSFDAAVLATTRHRDPTVDTAYISMHLRDRPIATARRLGCANVHLQYLLCFVPGLVASAHRHDLTVNAWTVDHPVVTTLLEGAGVDGIIVDDPAVAASFHQ